MKIILKLNKDVNKNAADYFEKAKKARKKWKGAEKALANSIKKLDELKKKQEKELEIEEQKRLLEMSKVKREKKWYEKFRWFVSSEGFLVIGGRDATTNEIIIKKHTDPADIVFHTEMAGSPFVVIKTNGKEAGEKTMEEAADFTATYSKAWKLGLRMADVFWINPDQVSKTAQAGEYLAKGSFMIYGKKNFMVGRMNLALAVTSEGIIAGPVEAIKEYSKDYYIIEQGDNKKSEIAKKIKSKDKNADLDEIMHYLPTGSLSIAKI